MADTQDTAIDEHHPDTLIFRTQQMVLDEAQHPNIETQASPSNQISLAPTTKQNSTIEDTTTIKQDPSPKKEAEPTARNIQHLIRRRKTHRANANTNTNTNTPRPDYAARNRGLQSRPRKVRRSRALTTTPYTSVLSAISSHIINDFVERPGEIDRYMRNYLRWFENNMPRDDRYWHQFKSEWCVWHHFYKNQPKRHAFPGTEPSTPRAYSRKEREDIYGTEKLRHAFQGVGI